MTSVEKSVSNITNSRRRTTYKVLAIAAVSAFAATAQAQSVWTGVTGNWGTAGNWSPSGVPAANTALVFGGGGYTSTNNLGNFTLPSLTSTLTSAAVVTGGTITFSGASASLLQNGSGALTISSAVALTNTTTVTGTGTGNVTITGRISPASGAVGLVSNYSGNLTLSGGATGGFLQVNSGTTTLTGSTNFAFSGTANPGVGTPSPAADVAISTGFTAGSSTLIMDGATANMAVSTNVMIAQNPGSTSVFRMINGSVLSNATSTVNAGGRFGVLGGTATVSIESGSSVTARLLEIGRADGSNVRMTVTGSGTTVTGSQLALARENASGSSMTAELLISNGGTVRVQPFGPAGSSAAVGGITFLGNGNTTGSIKVTSGGTFSTSGQVQLALSGTLLGGTGTGSIVVDGAGSLFSVGSSYQTGTTTPVSGANGYTFVSDTPEYNSTIDVTNGARFVTFGLQHGFADTLEVGNFTFNVTSGSTAVINNAMLLGGGSLGVSTAVIDSSTVLFNQSGTGVGGLTLGWNGSGTATMTVRNNSVLSAPDTAQWNVGAASGAVATLSIESGSTATTGIMTIGREGSSGTLTINGGTFTANDISALGTLYTASSANDSTSRMYVQNGGVANFLGGLSIGRNADLNNGSQSAQVTVTGTGSVLNTGDSFLVVGHSDGADAVLTVANGGSVTTSELDISLPDIGGTALVNVGSGSSITVNGGTFIGTTGKIVMTGGAVTSSFLSNIGDASTGSIEINGGTFTLNGSTLTEVSGAETTAAISGTGGALVVDSANLVQFFSNLSNTYSGNLHVKNGAAVFASATDGGAIQLNVASISVGANATFENPAILQFDSPNADRGTGEARAVGNVIVTGTLNISGTGPNYTGIVDIQDNDLIVTNSSETLIRSYVAAWWNGGLRDGNGLLSGLSFAEGLNELTTVAVVGNNNGTGGVRFSSFAGITGLDSNDVLVKFTYIGDTNLDGEVTEDDLVATLNGIRLGLTGWWNGDTNYDGVVDGDDLANLLVVARLQGEILASGTGGFGNGGAVPEPAALGLLLAGVPLMGRRRRA